MRIKKLKKQEIIAFLIIFSLMFLTNTARSGERPSFIQRFSIKMSSGLSDFSNIGDINATQVSGNEMHVDHARYFNGSRYGELKEIRTGSDSEIEVAFDVASWLRFYFSSGYAYARKESSSGFEVTPPGFYNVEFTFSPTIRIRTIPLELGVSCVMPFVQKAKMFIKGGIGYYFTRTSFYYEETEIWTREDGFIMADFDETADWDLKSKAIGYHWGIGFEYAVARNISLTLEIQGRSVKMKELKGTEIFLGSGFSESFYGSLYYYEKIDSITEKYYSHLGFYKEKPERPYPTFMNIRKAGLDLSGYFLKIGIRIRLF
jgi:opacity protein-like surface antigen